MAAKRSARPRPFKPPLTPSPPPSTLSSPPSPSVLPTLLSWQFGLYLVIGLAIRFWNFSQSQYFIWDQGRDIWQIQAIINGDFTLIGPTTGIAGFFLGPIWFYLGVPGLLLGGGSPWVLNAWFILVASLSLPFFWLLSHQLFGNKRWAMLNAYLLTLVPGSITGSLTIWNPLLSLPLMAGAIWTLLQARRSLPHLLLSFFLLGLALQSEFAYAVFLVGPLWLAIPWLRSKFKWQEMALSAVVIGVTLFPQLLFEFRHNLVMTNGVIASLSDQSQQIDWATLWR